VAAEFLGPSLLRLGSRDSAATGTFVADLQAELRRLRLLEPGAVMTPGVFDSATDLAVRRLQWFAANVPGSLSAAGAFVARGLAPLDVDGVVGPDAKKFLLALKTEGSLPTGLLVRIDFDAFSHLRPNANFVALLPGGTRFGVCEREFAAVIAAMNDAAQAFGVFAFVNQLFRLEDAVVSGAVVEPAKASAHKIGRAVDLQLGNSRDGSPLLSNAIKDAAPGTPFAKFREHAKAVLKCRYGGDFQTVDAPHFDRQIDAPGGSATWRLHHFFDQLQMAQAKANPAAIPPFSAGAA
jgi:hypothetical protein